MALSVINDEGSARVGRLVDWPAVQFAQFEHDEKYHREISRLTVQDRLKHMALHFAKYAGRLFEPLDEATFKRTAVDTMIIAVSCANILNLAVDREKLPETAALLSREQFTRDLAISAGKIATACEKLDHLEEFPYRQALRAEILQLLGSLIALFESERWKPTLEMHARLAGVKKKSIFHGRP